MFNPTLLRKQTLNTRHIASLSGYLTFVSLTSTQGPSSFLCFKALVNIYVAPVKAFDFQLLQNNLMSQCFLKYHIKSIGVKIHMNYHIQWLSCMRLPMHIPVDITITLIVLHALQSCNGVYWLYCRIVPGTLIGSKITS